MISTQTPGRPARRRRACRHAASAGGIVWSAATSRSPLAAINPARTRRLAVNASQPLDVNSPAYGEIVVHRVIGSRTTGARPVQGDLLSRTHAGVSLTQKSRRCSSTRTATESAVVRSRGSRLGDRRPRPIGAAWVAPESRCSRGRRGRTSSDRPRARTCGSERMTATTLRSRFERPGPTPASASARPACMGG